MTYKITDQRLVHYVVRKLTEQGAPAVAKYSDDAAGICVNIADDGKRCALGICFKPSSAERFHNAQLARSLIAAGASAGVVDSLRHAHDNAAAGHAEHFVLRFRHDLRCGLDRVGLSHLTLEPERK